MVIKVELVDCTNDAEIKIATYAAICYDAKTDPLSLARRVKHLIGVGHLSTLRFAYATFRVSGISRVCSHQLVRHKHLDYLQESQRYVDQDGVSFTNSEDDKLIKQHNEYCLDLYNSLREAGMKKEDARFVLPQSVETQMMVTGNLQAWKDFLNLRLDKKAQKEIRTIAAFVALALGDIAPSIFETEKELALEILLNGNTSGIV